jgi:uncharacterized membrane protein
MMHWGNYAEIGHGGIGFEWIWMLLFWALVIFGAVYLIKRLTGSCKSPAHKESADEILKKKYATGEITLDDYNEKMSVIRK